MTHYGAYPRYLDIESELRVKVFFDLISNWSPGKLHIPDQQNVICHIFSPANVKLWSTQITNSFLKLRAARNGCQSPQGGANENKMFYKQEPDVPALIFQFLECVFYNMHITIPLSS